MRHAYCNANCDCYVYSNPDSYSHSHCHRHGNSNCNSNCDHTAAAYTHATASAYTAAPSVGLLVVSLVLELASEPREFPKWPQSSCATRDRVQKSPATPLVGIGKSLCFTRLRQRNA